MLRPFVFPGIYYGHYSRVISFNIRQDYGVRFVSLHIHMSWGKKLNNRLSTWLLLIVVFRWHCFPGTLVTVAHAAYWFILRLIEIFACFSCQNLKTSNFEKVSNLILMVFVYVEQTIVKTWRLVEFVVKCTSCTSFSFKYL